MRPLSRREMQGWAVQLLADLNAHGTDGHRFTIDVAGFVLTEACKKLLRAEEMKDPRYLDVHGTN